MKTWTAILTLLLLLFGLLLSAASVLAAPASEPPAAAQPTKVKGNGPGNGNGNAFGLANKPEKTVGAQGDDDDDDGAPGPKVNYQGTLAAVDDSSVTVTLRGGLDVTLALSDTTRIHVPRLGYTATVDNLNVGMRVKVQALPGGAAGMDVALRIHAIPGKPQKLQRAGIVAAYTAGSSITVEGRKGGSTTFQITSETQILPPELAGELAVGRRVTVVSPRNVTGGEPTARAIVVHPLPGSESDD